MEALFPFFLVMGAVFAGVIVFAYLAKQREIRRASSWPKTTGTVTQSRMRNRKVTDMDGKSSFISEPLVAYEYEVDGKNYRGQRISFAERISGPDVQVTLDRYPIGKMLPVYYNPGDPGESVLEREMPSVVKKGVGGLTGCFLGAAVVIPLVIIAISRWLASVLPNADNALFVTLAAGIGLVVLMLTYVVQRQVWDARNWSMADGRILSPQVEAYQDWSNSSPTPAWRTFFRSNVIYAFEAKGQQYINNRVHFGMQVGWSRASLVMPSLARYPEDSPVSVFYDPQDPSQAVLERRAPGVILLAVVGVALLGLAVLASGLI